VLWRRDRLGFDSTDLFNSANSFNRLEGFSSPKETHWPIATVPNQDK